VTTRGEDFSNAQVEVSQLPDYRSVPLSPVAAGYRPWALISQVSFWVILAIGLWILPRLPFATIDLVGWYALPIASLLLGLITAVYVAVDARVRGWALREHDLIYRYGIFWRKTVILPFARIQHVEAIQGPLERYFDLMRLKCFTAGGLSADLVVKGLDSASARRVRGFLLEQIAASGPTDGEEALEDDERG
jgi:membrane protein YdbS with pleckstrin-like domain